MPSEQVDIIVIGSSPILMLYALRSRKEGKTVILIEESNAMGGAWSIDSHSIGLRNIKHENACHLIEWYSGGYELIECISGVHFLPLDPQPIKVWRKGRRELYTSRISIFFSCIISCRSIIYSVIKLGISYLGLGKYKTEAGWSNLSNAFSRMIMEFRYRLLSIAEFDGIRNPEGGFTHFVHHLSDQLGLQGVNIVRGRASGLVLEADGSGYITIGERKIHGTSITVGESSVLAINKKKNFRFTSYHHVLIAVRASDTISRNAYIHYPDHPVFHRITYVEDTVDEDGIEVAVFLIQLRLPLEDIPDLKIVFEQAQNLYPIVRSSSYFKSLKSINSNHISSSVDSEWHSFDRTAPFVLKTIGDLSRNMLLMQHAFLDKK